jgi:hypothetical protein
VWPGRCRRLWQSVNASVTFWLMLNLHSHGLPYSPGHICVNKLLGLHFRVASSIYSLFCLEMYWLYHAIHASKQHSYYMLYLDKTSYSLFH